MLLIVGKEERLHVRGQLRGFLQSERAQYIAQDEVESDAALLVEQEEAERVNIQAKADKEAKEQAAEKAERDLILMGEKRDTAEAQANAQTAKKTE